MQIDWVGIAGLLGAVGVIIKYILDYTQKTYNERKAFELKNKEEAAKRRALSDKVHSQRIFGEIWRMLAELVDAGATRVFIIQPHPLSRPAQLSVYYEARARGVMSICTDFHTISVSEVPGLHFEISTRDFFYWPTLTGMKDKRAFALFHNLGTESMACKRMIDADGQWCGSLVVTFGNETPTDATYLKGKMFEVANDLQYIIPEIV